MNIGFISTWLERGASYVTKAYIEALKDCNNIFVYARGGEEFAKGDSQWDLNYVTWGLKLSGTKINFKHLKKWIIENSIEVLFFNEQREMEVLALIKKELPSIKLGAYIDYYKEDSINEFFLYDFLICNTKRHYSVFKNHPQCYYVPWGTDLELFKAQHNNNNDLTFFHSVGMSMRKGTDLLLKAFIDGQIYKHSRLVIHSQLNFEENFGYKIKELETYNIDVIEKTVTAPGLYYLGDVYVYPTTLDGLGLTIYEALSCGLPVITTNNAPMNEVVNNDIGFLVDVERYCSRTDGYYWPLSICSKESLIRAMMYYIENKNELSNFKKKSRQYALSEFDWKSRYIDIRKIFTESKILDDYTNLDAFILKRKKENISKLKGDIIKNIPDNIAHIINTIKR